MAYTTISDIKRRVQEIRDHAPDFEAQHALEDALFKDAMTAISEGMAYPNPEDFAREVLTVCSVNFGRHCA